MHQHPAETPVHERVVTLPSSPSLLIVDDHTLVRLGVRTLVTQHFNDQFNVVEAGTLEQALTQLRHAHPPIALLVLDLQLPDAKGFAGLQIVLRDHPHLPVAVLSGAQDPRVREEALRLGALAFICKTADASGLVGLLDVLRNHLREAAASAPANSFFDTRPMPSQPAPQVAEGLSPRQVQVLELLLSGMDNHAIGAETGLSLGTVKNYVSSVFLSFNVRSRAELLGMFPS